MRYAEGRANPHGQIKLRTPQTGADWLKNDQVSIAPPCSIGSEIIAFGFNEADDVHAGLLLRLGSRACINPVAVYGRFCIRELTIEARIRTVTRRGESGRRRRGAIRPAAPCRRSPLNAQWVPSRTKADWATAGDRYSAASTMTVIRSYPRVRSRPKNQPGSIEL